MIKEVHYIKLQEVLSRCLRHPKLQDVTLEAAVLYAVDFIHVMGMPDMFLNKEEIIHIEKHRGELPCDLIAVNQVMDMHTHQCMRSMTDTFEPVDHCRPEEEPRYGYYTKPDELTFKVQNRIITTSIEHGDVKISYTSIPVDEDGFPLLIDNPTFIKALELYIKKEAFTILFDEGKITPLVLLNTQLEYAWKVGLVLSEFTIPSESEMESICRSWTTLLQRTTDFDNGWKNLGDREYYRRH